MTSQWPRWRLKSPASRLFTQPFIQAQVKEKIKAPSHWPLWGDFTGDRWIPRTRGKWLGKCFHLMTSSWFVSDLGTLLMIAALCTLAVHTALHALCHRAYSVINVIDVQSNKTYGFHGVKGISKCKPQCHHWFTSELNFRLKENV